jgi:hypothetical protein
LLSKVRVSVLRPQDASTAVDHLAIEGFGLGRPTLVLK